MSPVLYNIIQIAIMALVTASTRFLPFICFKDETKRPKIVLYLGKVLPYAIMGMLVVYCLKDTSMLSYPYALPELLGIAITAVLHILFKNSMISIFGGTIIYMMLTQLVF